MSRDHEYLIDMLEAARLACSYIAGKSESEFLADVQCQDAVIRRLEVIGEAAGRLSEATTHALPDVPWASMVGMRNIMIHRYDDIDLSIVWNSVRDALPPIVESIERFLRQREDG